MIFLAMSSKAGQFNLISSQRSGRPPDLWHLRQTAEDIQMIRKEKPGTAWTRGTACHTATAALRASLTQAAAQRCSNYISQHALGFSNDNSLSLMGKRIHMAYHVMTPKYYLIFFQVISLHSGSTTQ